MKILFVTPEFEEQARGITGIVKAMIRAAKADGHEVGVLVGYPKIKDQQSQRLALKVEHIYLQHYLATGKKDLFPAGLRGKKKQLQIIAGRDYLNSDEIAIDHGLVSQSSNLANSLDFIVKIPYVYQFINHGLESVAKRTLKKAVKKANIDMVITGTPMNITANELGRSMLGQFVHDTMPLDLLETPPDNDTPQRFAQQLYAAASGSDIVFTNSEDTKSKVLEVNPKANVDVLYGIASNQPAELPETLIMQNHHLEKDKYLLFISVIEKRKNIVALLDAYAKVHDKIGAKLVIVGPQGYGYKDIMAHYRMMPEAIQEKIIFTGFISEADKYTLLRNARAFVFPSIYEGIGLPIIEAYNSGLVVLTSRRGALPEAAGDAAYYIEDPYSIDEIANGLLKIADDEKLRKKLKQHIPTQTKKFTREKFNQRFAEGLKGLI